MQRSKVITIVAIVALAAVLMAFGPAPDDGGADNTLRVTSLTPPDSIDPGVSWQSLSWAMQVNVYNGLLTFRKESGAAGTELVPDIAEAMPEMSDGGRTLTFTVRRGVMFGPPLNREVQPSDIKYTFDRLAKIPSQGAGFFGVIEGFDTVYESGKGSVSGVVADDQARTVTFHLTRPDATFLYSLALPFSFAVPKGTPAEDLSMGDRVPATGPYMFAEYDPARRVVLERNPAFKEWTPDTPKGKVDKIVVTLKVSDDNATTLIMQGKADMALTAIPRSRLPFLETSDEWKPYLHAHQVSAVSYLWMNVNQKPFDNVKVRQAVNWAINRRAIVKLTGGSGAPTSNILPPTIPGSPEEQAYPKQDMKKAKQLIAESGITPGDITLWCMTTPPGPDMAQYLQEVLRQLGFNARTRCLDYSAYYNVVGVKKNNTQIGFAQWGADFPEGATFIDTNLNGAHINPDHSPNMAWYSGADAEIARIGQMLDLDERAKAWGEVDRRIMTEDAPWAPLYNRVQRNLIGKRVGGYTYHPLYDVLFMKATVDGSGENNSKTHAGEIGYEDEAPAEGEGGE